MGHDSTELVEVRLSQIMNCDLVLALFVPAPWMTISVRHVWLIRYNSRVKNLARFFPIRLAVEVFGLAFLNYRHTNSIHSFIESHPRLFYTIVACAVVFFIYIAWHDVRRMLRRRRTRAGLCPTCGYDLRVQLALSMSN